MLIRPKTVVQDKNYTRNLRTQVEHLQTRVQVLFLYVEFDGNIKKISNFTGLSRNTIYKILDDKEFLDDLFTLILPEK